MKSSIKILALIALLPAIRNGRMDHQAMYRAAATAVGMLPPVVVRSDTEIPVETWTYNFGPQRLMQRIRFENGVIVKIESIGYGC